MVLYFKCFRANEEFTASYIFSAFSKKMTCHVTYRLKGLFMTIPKLYNKFTLDFKIRKINTSNTSAREQFAVFSPESFKFLFLVCFLFFSVHQKVNNKCSKEHYKNRI